MKIGYRGAAILYGSGEFQIRFMKPIPIRFFLAVAAFACVATALVTGSQTVAPTPKQSEVEKAILARLNEIQTAAQALDADKVFSFVMENNAGVVAQNGKIFMTRADALESTRQSFQSLQNAGAHIEYRFDHQEVTLLAPAIALVTAEGVTSVTTEDGRISKTPFAQSVVLLLTNGDWKVFHAHRSFVSPPR
ncbi:MAG TPA: nuclear transport factor 2 family protein [Verrucomicrobiae bacterium]|nr:nuclear transport factor 2 family protein [Verrucomicrobiae bacterium]